VDELTRLSPEVYRERVNSLMNLPTLPIIATEILRIVREDRLSVSQILPIIERDPPLAMKVLRFANSAYYGLREKVKSLRHAMVVIGMKQLSQLAMTFTLIKALTRTEQNEYGVPWKQFWEHSTACGHIAQLLSEHIDVSTSTSPYSLGLLHDIGKLVLYRIHPEGYRVAFKVAKVENRESYEVESEILGVNHSEVGRWIAEKWDLPDIIVKVIGYHHNVEVLTDESKRQAATVIQIADMLCNYNSLVFGMGLSAIDIKKTGDDLIHSRSSYMNGINFDHFNMQIQPEINSITEMVGLMQA